MNSKRMLCGILLVLGIIILPFSQKCYAQTKVKQGIAGEVIWKEGNHMPGIGTSPGITKKVSREIVVYPIINQKDVQQADAPFFSKIKAKKVATLKSGKNGKYYIRLPKGRYSVFVLEKGKLYANQYDGEGNINPVEIEKNKLTTLDLILDYKAAY
ncbi:MAG: hypothetical protein WC756_17530 [Taibaiella sp.]|jgi:hypothetical protein